MVLTHIAWAAITIFVSNSCNVQTCKVYSNWIGKVFAFLFKSDRPACIRYIKEQGEQAFAEEMTRRKCQTIKKK